MTRNPWLIAYESVWLWRIDILQYAINDAYNLIKNDSEFIANSREK